MTTLSDAQIRHVGAADLTGCELEFKYEDPAISPISIGAPSAVITNAAGFPFVAHDSLTHLTEQVNGLARYVRFSQPKIPCRHLLVAYLALS